MPTISEFFGIVVRMYFDDHSPPHFHAYHGSSEAVFAIDTPRLLRGDMSSRSTAMILRWARCHQRELMDNWHRAASHLPLIPVPPLSR